MRNKSFAVLLIFAAFLLGYMMDHKTTANLKARSGSLESELSRSQALVRLAVLENQLLRLSELVSAGDFDSADQSSTRFYDNVRAELRLSDGETSIVLREILDTRDVVTAGIARKDPASSEVLSQNVTRFRLHFERNGAKAA